MRRALVAILLSTVALAGCAKPDDPIEGASVLPPVLAIVPDVVTGLEHVANVEFGAGNDLAFHGDLVFVATHNNGMHIVDAKDPFAPVELAVVPCNGKDIGAVALGERLIVTISSQSDDGCPDAAPKGGIRLVDVTNASAPVVLGQVALKYGSHTHTPYGDTGLVYNSAYNLASNPMASPMDHHRAEIIDISNPEAPEVVGEFLFPATSTSIGCHDIHAEPELDRAICAAVSETMIWDMTDPLQPKIMSTIHNPLLNIHHSATTARGGDLLILGDEFTGAIAPACHPVGKAPTGAMWFYDISDPAKPKQLGHFPPVPGSPGTVCTAHNFNVVEGKDLVVAGFFSAGTLLVDFSDPSAPKLVTQMVNDPTSSWASYYHRGVVFSGDGVRGLDLYVLK